MPQTPSGNESPTARTAVQEIKRNPQQCIFAARANIRSMQPLNAQRYSPAAFREKSKQQILRGWFCQASMIRRLTCANTQQAQSAAQQQMKREQCALQMRVTIKKSHPSDNGHAQRLRRFLEKCFARRKIASRRQAAGAHQLKTERINASKVVNSDMLILRY